MSWDPAGSAHGCAGYLCTCSSHLPLLPHAAGSGEQAIHALLDCLVGVVRKDGRRGSRPYELVTSLNKRLSRLGLWTGPGGRQGGFQLLRGYSQHLVDSPPVAGEEHGPLHPHDPISAHWPVIAQCSTCPSVGDAGGAATRIGHKHLHHGRQDML
jgi:hypothetical protein